MCNFHLTDINTVMEVQLCEDSFTHRWLRLVKDHTWKICKSELQLFCYWILVFLVVTDYLNLSDYLIWLISLYVDTNNCFVCVTCVINSYLWSILHISNRCCCLQVVLTALAVLQSGITADKGFLILFWFPLLSWYCENKLPHVSLKTETEL